MSVRRSAEHGFTSLGRSAEHGFTLVEVMVALAIFATIAAAGVAILGFGVRAGAAAAKRLDGTAALDRTVSLLGADLAQATDRPARDEGGVPQPAFVAEGGAPADGAPFLALVRSGWQNLDDAPRASVQKVAWRLRGGAIERVAWPAIDGAAPATAAAMMAGVAAVRLRYRIRGAWSDRWDGRGPQPLPEATEVAITRADGTTWRTMFVVGTTPPPPTLPPFANPTPTPGAPGAR